MRSIGRDPDMPNQTTISDWVRLRPDFALQYARATEERADAIFEEMFEIADDATNDFVERARLDGSVDVVFDTERVLRSKLRIDTRKWALARMAPKKYGERVGIDLAGDLNLNAKLDLSGLTEEQLRALASIPLPKT